MKEAQVPSPKFVNDKPKDRKYLKVAAAAVIIVLVVGSSLFQLKIFWLSSNDRHCAGELKPKTFRVAAYEQKLVNAVNATTREEALVAIRGNLANIKAKADIANSMGADVIVFAEYGITGDMAPHIYNRSSVYPYMEEIPDVSKSNLVCVSCDNIDPTVEGQTTIGCIALKHRMYVLANLIESVPCDTEQDSKCPSDGHYQYNTNIAYDPKGCLIAKYHKFHRYAEEFSRLDKPAKPEYVFFDTEYGRFGTMICQDAVYKDPGIGLVEDYNIDHMVFPTYWTNTYPYELAVEWQIAFATVTNVNFIGANIHSPEYLVFGSSILSGSVIVNYTSDSSDPEGTLLIGDLPTSRPPKPPQKAVADTVELPPANQKAESVVIYHDLYNATVLDKLSGSAQVCHTDICCALDYTRNTTEELYILGAFKGQHTYDEMLAIENCLVYKCANESLSSCKDPEVSSTTAFSHLKLSAAFKVKSVYPALIPSDFAFQNLNFSFGSVEFHHGLESSSDWPLVSIALAGRDFKHDPIA